MPTVTFRFHKVTLIALFISVRGSSCIGQNPKIVLYELKILKLIHIPVFISQSEINLASSSNI